MHETHTVQTSEGKAEVRIRRTTVDGQRGWVWEWRMEGSDEWSEPNGPLQTKVEAREWALDTTSGF